MSMEKHIGVSRLHMLDGHILRNQILIFRNGKLVAYYPLTKEEAFTAWIGGDFYLEDTIKTE